MYSVGMRLTGWFANRGRGLGSRVSHLRIALEHDSFTSCVPENDKQTIVRRVANRAHCTHDHTGELIYSK